MTTAKVVEKNLIFLIILAWGTKWYPLRTTDLAFTTKNWNSPNVPKQASDGLKTGRLYLTQRGHSRFSTS